MKIRIVGTEAEVTQAAEKLADILVIRETSRPYPRRGGSDVSVYVEADLPHVARAREQQP